MPSTVTEYIFCHESIFVVGLTYGNGERENHVNGPKNRGRGDTKKKIKKYRDS